MTHTIWDQVNQELQPFVDASWLTTFTRNPGAKKLEDGELRLAPITIIGTGYTPINNVIAMDPRFIFRDGPLMDIDQRIGESDGLVNGDWNGDETDQSGIYYHSTLSPLASDSVTTAVKRYSVQAQESYARVAPAHAKGIQARWWGIDGATDILYKAQQLLHADLIQADDLADAVALETETKASLARCQ
jgi:hypothetical protein